MSTTIICPNCQHQFEPTEALAQTIKEEMRKQFNQKWLEEKKELEKSFSVKEADVKKQQEQLLQEKEQLQKQAQAQQQEFNRKLEEQRKAMESELSAQLAQKIKGDFETKLKLLEDTNKTNESKLVEAREKELEFLKQMQNLKTREQELELEVQRKIADERAKLGEIIKKEEDEKNKLREAEFQLKLREKDMQLEAQNKLVEEMKRRAEQGSMQLQGEAQELALEELLRHSFPFDLVSEVGKGVRGADCILTVRNSYGQECGKIIFESKRTKDFSEDWIEKLKADSRTLNADVAVIVTQAMPKDMQEFGERQGVWICSFADVKPLIHVLRDLVMKVYLAGKSQENKGDKMNLLYNYLVSSEFAEQWSAIREGFMGMKMSIQRERDQMEKLWKAREKQLEKVLLNAAHIRGSIEGISGMDVDLDLLGDGNTYALGEG